MNCLHNRLSNIIIFISFRIANVDIPHIQFRSSCQHQQYQDYIVSIWIAIGDSIRIIHITISSIASIFSSLLLSTHYCSCSNTHHLPRFEEFLHFFLHITVLSNYSSMIIENNTSYNVVSFQSNKCKIIIWIYRKNSR